MLLGPDHFAKSKVIVPSPTCQLKGFGGRLFYYNSLRDPPFHHFPLYSPHCSPADSSLFFITVTFSEALECTHCPARVIFKVIALIHTHFLQVSPYLKHPSAKRPSVPHCEEVLTPDPQSPLSSALPCFPYVTWAVSFVPTHLLHGDMFAFVYWPSIVSGGSINSFAYCCINLFPQECVVIASKTSCT